MTADGAALRAKLEADAARFDDAALEHLSNRGLVRRAQKLLREELTITASEESVDIVAGEWRVSFLAAEPLTQGRCACATAGVCQHLIGAILHLGHQFEDGQSSPAAATSILSAMLAISDDELLAWSKKADRNWARTRVASIDPAEVVVEESANLSVLLPTPHGAVRFLGPTMDSAIVKPSGRNDRRVVALAVLALWAIEGRALVQPEGAGIKPTELAPERRRVVDRAQALCCKLVAVGLLHLGDADREHLDSLAASARGVKLHRLALLAERASDEVQALSDQSAEADTARLLGQLAEINVVAELIGRLLDGNSPLPDGVAGVARARFESIGHLDLSCLGTYTWGDGRFGGSTAVLADDRGRVYTVSKPSSVAGRPLPEAIGWAGVGGVGSLAGRRVALSSTKASWERRLSTSVETQATLGTFVVESDVKSLVWDGTRPSVPSRLHGRERADWRVLAVQAGEPVRFDELEQRLVWPLTSASTSIDVVMPYRPANRAAIQRLERIVASGIPDLVVGRLRTAGQRLEVWPISVFVGGSFLNLATAPIGAPVRVGPDGEQERTGGTPDHLERLAVRLVGLAERGVRELRDDRLSSFVRTCGSWGFRSLADVMSRSEHHPEVAILRAEWMLAGLRDLQA